MQQQQRQQQPYKFTKIILIAVLAGLCVFLQCTVWTLEVLLEERRAVKQQQQQQKSKQPSGDDILDLKADEQERHKKPRTHKSSEITTDPHDLYLHRLSGSSNKLAAPTGVSKQVQAAAYWKQAVELWLRTWDPTTGATLESATTTGTTMDDDAFYYGSSSSSRYYNSKNVSQLQAAWAALEQAANYGHPQAQFHVANALASGIFANVMTLDNHGRKIKIQTEWTLPDSHQQQRAWLLWHMAAIGGYVEAMLAMAYRLEMEQSPQQQQLSQTQQQQQAAQAMGLTAPLTAAACAAQLPYFQQAALGIMDALEIDPMSRAKVAPATDKHILYQIHLHGGTPSKLDYHNKADESPDALQFYHLRAMSTKKSDTETAASAAFTLANYYHYGVRGVTQNLTLAAQYYERAANLNHWEAAGQVGTMYLWGIGVPQDAYAAHKFFQLGMPLGIAGCQRRYQAKLKKNSIKGRGAATGTGADGDNDETNEADLSICDTESINGMGVLKLMGLPHIMKVSVEDAAELFIMARDQGSADAAYNHAMLKLGWTTHWKQQHSKPTGSGGQVHSSSSLQPQQQQQQQQTSIEDYLFPKSSNSASMNHPTLNEYQLALTDLTMAAGKGHLQAKLRLGLLFANGVKIPDAQKKTIQAVAQDCPKALKQFKWITDHACPYRAKRLRLAYKQYMAGYTDRSLLNYLAAAETGSTVGLLNAAFLLEQGECLSSSSSSSSSVSSSDDASTSSFQPLLGNVDCAKASARLWKAAASRGNGEASLRVGDFYYYRRFRKHDASGHLVAAVGPFGWVRYLLYPEESLPLLWKHIQGAIIQLLQEQGLLPGSDVHKEKSSLPVDENDKETSVCQVENESGKEQECHLPDQKDEAKAKATLQSDLEMAAHYYRLATETVDSARAHFNLGFLYEWGLGLKQDFPLAKRHYDLAVSSSVVSPGGTREADLPVAIALTAMNVHEKILKGITAAETWWKTTAAAPFSIFGNNQRAEQVRQIIKTHVASWESVALIVLTIILMILVQMREQARPRR